MIKKILSAFLFAFVIFVAPIVADARSGCCSHHGGVCGCECCDGTALSATCAPYYPACAPKTEAAVQPITNTTESEKFKLLSDVNGMLAT